MLLRFKVQNFLSFNEEASFDMFPNIKRTSFPNHIYDGYKVPLLKQAAIYGANGSGKSNLLKAVGFVKNFATNKSFLNPASVGINRFRLKKEQKEALSFAIEFYHQAHYFLYHIEIGENEIISEELSLLGLGEKENELIYVRRGQQIETPGKLNSEVEKAIENVLKSNPLASLISLNNEFPILDACVEIAYDWFKNCLHLKSLHNYNRALISQMSNDPSLLHFANDLISMIGLGVEKIEIEERKLNELLSDEDKYQLAREAIRNEFRETGHYAFMRNDKVLWGYKEKNEEQMVEYFLFHQLGIGGFKNVLTFDSQSDGTAKILDLIPVLYDLIHHESIYFIDEIENSIHPMLIAALMKFYAQIPTKGQLIYTTHETELLNQQELMRPDEVWFAEKHEGQTQLYSLNEFKAHNTINIKNGYLDGRYGAIPFIGDLYEPNCEEAN